MATKATRKKKLQSFLLRLLQVGKIILPSFYKPPLQPKSGKKSKGSPFSDAVIEGRG